MPPNPKSERLASACQVGEAATVGWIANRPDTADLLIPARLHIALATSLVE